jgi:hypothetical protein
MPGFPLYAAVNAILAMKIMTGFATDFLHKPNLNIYNNQYSIIN